ncbi:MAG: tetratricopeptide repeat protein [Alphaproteobacteria bacterium]|nr:tetratricopeptide repeat protein [Alphaproteobacteria bacterium]
MMQPMPSANFQNRLRSVQAAMMAGDRATALSALDALEREAQESSASLQQIGQLYTQNNLHEAAARAFARAVALSPREPGALYNLATAEIALGHLSEAERLLDRVIALNPHDYDAWYNRATLKRQTRESNHIPAIEALLSQPLRNPAGIVQLGYALAKELEDTGEHARSFAAMKRGADARRRLLAYRVESDEAAMTQIAQVFDAAFFAAPKPGFTGARPIFVLGLPRSGTTLVDRILSSHSTVESRGESTDFALSLVTLAGEGAKQDLIRRSASLDFAALGAGYANRQGESAMRLIDKTPLNFLYIGLIAKALPDAVIVHVRRGAMDVCYAIYKTLFRMAYPFSYDLSDLGRYYLAYRKLMAHWEAMLPGRIVTVDYEDLVRDQEAATRKLIADCGLPWEDACLAFERNAAPSLTASAAQVRQPIYASSLGLWRQYERELAPLEKLLNAGGIETR